MVRPCLRWLKDIIQRLYPFGIFRTGKAIYLTFDDGPIPEVTPKVLDILARYKVKATFFMVGENIDKHPEVFAQVVQAGHSVGNHTYNHLKGWDYSLNNYLENVQKWEDAYKRCLSAKQSVSETVCQQSGLSAKRSFRPPYGKATFRQRKALHRLGYRIIYWDILTRDYNAKRTPAQMADDIRRNVRPGSIINFHDSLKSNERMLEVLPQAIEWLLAQGYELKQL